MQSKFWLVLLLIFSGCKAHHSPLDEQLAQLKIETVSEIQAPPLIEFALARYQAHQLRQPFALPLQGVFIAAESKATSKCQPPLSTPSSSHQSLSDQLLSDQLLSDQPSHLASFELNQLEFKGVISRGEQHSAIIKAPTGDLALVTAGHYLGTQGNKVLKIDADAMLIEQRVSTQGQTLSKNLLTNEQECWQRRTIRWALK